MLVAYEDIRIRPKGELTREIMSQNFLEELDTTLRTELVDTESPSNSAVQPHSENLNKQASNHQVGNITGNLAINSEANHHNMTAGHEAMQEEENNFRSSLNHDSDSDDEPGSVDEDVGNESSDEVEPLRTSNIAHKTDHQVAELSESLAKSFTHDPGPQPTQPCRTKKGGN